MNEKKESQGPTVTEKEIPILKDASKKIDSSTTDLKKIAQGVKAYVKDYTEKKNIPNGIICSVNYLIYWQLDIYF